MSYESLMTLNKHSK